MSQWQTIDLEGIPVDLWEPSQTTGPGALLYLHGYRGETPVTHPGLAEVLTASGLPVLAPRGGRSWWLDRESGEFQHELTPLQFLRGPVAAECDRRWGIGSPLIGVIGLSMGGQGALQLAYRYPREFPCVAAISPAVDFQDIFGRGFQIEELFPSAEAARQETVTLRMNPLSWPKHQFLASDPLDLQWHPGAVRLYSKLTSSGIPCEADLETSLGGHTWNYFTHQLQRGVRFLQESLSRVDQERAAPRPI